jgi:hypothetical protein
MENIPKIGGKAEGSRYLRPVFTLKTANSSRSVSFSTQIPGFRDNPVKYTDPDGNESLLALFLITAKSDVIQRTAEKYDVDPLGIGMILYQENFWGIETVNIKDKIGLLLYTHTDEVNDKTYDSFSVGIGQIQLRRGAELLGININNKGAKKEIYDKLMDHDKSIDLIAANIKFEEGLLGRRLKGEEAGFVHNMGSTGYTRYLNGQKVDDHVPLRSVRDLNVIKDALNGKIEIPAYKDWGHE